jgi:hypothetical protein
MNLKPARLVPDTLRPRCGVGQDKSPATTAPTNLIYAAPHEQPMGAQLKPRRQIVHATTSSGRTKVSVHVWMEPPVADELKRVARVQGLSVSETCSAIVKDGLTKELHKQHATLLEPLIIKVIHKEMRNINNRLASMLAEVFYNSTETKQLAINILARQPARLAMDEETLNHIRDESRVHAKESLRSKNPHIVNLVKNHALDWLLMNREDDSEKP